MGQEVPREGAAPSARHRQSLWGGSLLPRMETQRLVRTYSACDVLGLMKNIFLAGNVVL